MPTNPRPRRGRLLLECLVAMLLLSAGALALAASTRAAASLADDATLVSRAQSLSTSGAEHAVLVGCRTVLGVVSSELPRVSVLATSGPSGGIQVTTLAASLALSPLSQRSGVALHASGAVACP